MFSNPTNQQYDRSPAVNTPLSFPAVLEYKADVISIDSKSSVEINETPNVIITVPDIFLNKEIDFKLYI